MTLCVGWWLGGTRSGAFESGGIDSGGVNQQHRNIILNRIYTPALTALQTLAVFFQNQLRLAHRTHENIEKVLGNHCGLILTPSGKISGTWSCDKIASQSSLQREAE